MRLTIQRRALIGQEIRQWQRASVVWSVLAVLAWFAAWALVLLVIGGCTSKPDVFQQQWDEAVLRSLNATHNRSLMKRE